MSYVNGWSIKKDEYECLISNLDSNKRLLEYGCGASTYIFSEYVSFIHSIEHDKKWFNSINQQLKDKGITNVQLHLHEPISLTHDLSFTPGDYDLHNTEEGKKLFFNYINGFKSLDFDDVLIDGRARKLVAIEILPYLKSNSFVYIHDFNNRPYYHNILEFYDVVESVNTLVKLRSKSSNSIKL